MAVEGGIHEDFLDPNKFVEQSVLGSFERFWLILFSTSGGI